MTLQTIEQALGGLSLADLRELNTSVVDAIKFKRQQEGNSVKRTLSVGDTVEFTNTKRGSVETGTIVKKNRTKAIVQLDGDHRHWTIPFSMLRKTA